MGTIMNLISKTLCFFENIFWYNLKRFKPLSFWRVFFFLINFMLFLSTLLGLPERTEYYIFIIVTLSNWLFIFTRINSRAESYQLLKQLGASRIFIITDNIIEVFIVFFITVFFYFVLTLYVKTSPRSFVFILFEAAAVLLFIPAVSVFILARMEKEIREL